LELEIRNLSKSYGSIRALNNLSLEVKGGTVLGLVGLNGSGKSTLIKILSGAIRPDGGEIIIDGRTVKIRSPRDAMRLGIGTAYQGLSLVPDLSVRDNLILGIEPSLPLGFIDRRGVEEVIGSLMSTFNVEIPLNAKIRSLPPEQRQLVEVLKAMARATNILLLDEPTSVLTRELTKRLFDVLIGLRSKGLLIVFVSHRLDEVVQISDKVAVMRDGRLAGLVDKGTPSDRIAELMTGGSLGLRAIENPSTVDYSSSPLFNVRELHVGGKVKGLSFSVKAGEVLGIGGLAGQGQAELLRALYGLLSYSGLIMVEGRECRIRNPRDALKCGVIYISGDKYGEGIFPNRPIRENILATKYVLSRALSLALKGRERVESISLSKILNIVYNDIEDDMWSLSGGNQQKVVIVRSMTSSPKVILLNDPLSEVDVSTKESFFEFIAKASKGRAIVFYSSDLKELLRVSNRILIMFEGRIIAELKGEELKDESSIAMRFYGVNE